MQARVVLTVAEGRKLDAFAPRRSRFWRKRGVASSKVDASRDDAQVDRLGVYGQYGVHRMAGLVFPWVDDRAQEVSLTIHGRTVHTNATVPGNRWLLFGAVDEFTADLAMLVTVDLLTRTVDLVGWVDQGTWIDEYQIETVTPAFGPQPVMPRSRLFRPEDLETVLVEGPWPPDPWGLPRVGGDTAERQREAREARERERHQQVVIERWRTRREIERGDDERQPPEYRGQVFEYADRDGIVPTAYPPYRDGPQESLSAEFIAFQAHNQTRYATHPEYYCPRCRIRYNTAAGRLCGICRGEEEAAQGIADLTQARRTRTGKQASEPSTGYPT